MLHDVTLGLNEGERVGVVGGNGAGKSTLMALMAGAEPPDEGAATRTTGLNAVLVGQAIDLDPAGTVREELVGGRPDHEWARDAAIREVLDGLLGGVAVSRFPQGLQTPTGRLSGGEQRRIMLARALLRARPTCSSSTSPPTTLTSRGSPGWPGSWPTTAGRWR